MRKLVIGGLATLGALFAGGCTPQMELTLSVRRDARLVYQSSTNTSRVTLSGSVSCTRPEPVDLSASISQYQTSTGTIESGFARFGSIRCEGPHENDWSATFEFVDTHFVPGFGNMSVTGSTNGSENVDNDTYTASRSIEMSS